MVNERPSAQNDVLAEKIATKTSSKPVVVNNQFYGASNEDDNTIYDDVNFEVSNQAVVVSSPAYGISADYYPTEAPFKNNPSYSTELPTRIYSSTASPASSEESLDYHNSVQFSQTPYDHSDIAYSPSDAMVVDDEHDDGNNAIGGSYSTPEALFTEKRTEMPEKNKFSKPIFKLKPTQHYVPSTEKYVLVHTISNEKQGEGSHDMTTKKPSSTNDSIQSIILMLNESNAGPEYNVDNNGESVTPSTVSFGSTVMIDREQYGSSSYYITTKSPSQRPTPPSVPSTSYVYSPNPTRRVTTRTTTTKNSNRVKITPTRGPQRPTTLNVPSTSYVYSPNPITKRPSTTASTPSTRKPTTANLVKKTTPKPSIIVKQPSPLVENNFVVISGGGITKHPSPTVHITPKPITNILTSSTVNQVKSKPSKRPSGEKTPTTTTTERPAFHSTTPATYVSSSIYVPAIQDFHNEGYFVVTHRPGEGVSSTTVYTINSGTVNAHPIDSTHIKLPGNIVSDPVNFAEDVPVMNSDDFSNFPPVRNPNLNMTATNMLEGEISTPTFVEDEQLSSKIDLLVSKLVASMQGNLDNLIDIVYERKNVSTAEQDIGNLHKNGTILQDTKPAKPTNKPPTKTPTGRPSQTTTKKAPTKASVTNKKPTTSTKKPPTKPQANSQTTKRPRTTTQAPTTKKPVRRVTTTSTTERAPSEDEEVIEEEGDENAEEVEEENEEENIVEESDGDATSSPQESGRIRKI